jgi:hypothetical protein
MVFTLVDFEEQVLERRAEAVFTLAAHGNQLVILAARIWLLTPNILEYIMYSY